MTSIQTTSRVASTRSKFTHTLASVACACAAGIASVAEADDCTPHWSPIVGEPAGVNGTIEAVAVFDDGTGPALYVGGEFTRAGGHAVNRIAKWDGSRWHDVGAGVNGTIRALAVYDDGSGPALYVGGSFSMIGGPGGTATNSIARWNGSEWSEVGGGIIGFVWSLTVHDFGDGGELVVGGFFSNVGGLVGEPGTVAANRIATWNGAVWSALGEGMASGPGGQVRSLLTFDDGLGGGPALYAAGSFLEADGNVVNRIARWDGQAWTGLGDGFNSHVWDLAAYDDGSGAALYAGGEFVSSGSVTVNRVAKWDPTTQTWSAVGGGMNNIVRSLLVIEETSARGSNSALYVAGNFTQAGGKPINRIAQWDGDTWSESPTNNHTNTITSLTLFDANDGNGVGLFVAGAFIGCGSGGICDRISRWDMQDGGWSPLGTGMNNALRAMAVFDDGSGDGPALHVGGLFASANGQTILRIGKWDAVTQTLTQLGGSVNNTTIWDMAVFDDGTGEALYAVGDFTMADGATVNRVARWDGQSWSALGNGLGGIARALAVYDDGSGGGSALYVGGQFLITADGLTVNRIARWDGTQWSAAGDGMNQTVSHLIVFDDGTGPALYAAGGFTTADGLTVNRIAKWDGTSWSGIGDTVPGVPALVTAMGVYDDGDGEALYVSFDAVQTSNGVMVNRIAKWDGTSWSPLGAGLNHVGSTMTTFDDGTGTQLYVGGAFTEADGQSIEYLARWDGANWTRVGSWASGLVSTSIVFDDGLETGPSLYIGGSFINSPAGDGRMAKWAGCAAPPCGVADFNCDGAVNVSDLLFLLGAWGQCPPNAACPADLNGDGFVDVSDLLMLFSLWG